MLQIWAKGLKQFITGTTNGSKHCLDVHVANTISTSAGSYAYKEHRLHDAASNNINASAGTWEQIDTAADVANTISELRVRNHCGSAIQVGKGANSGAVTVIGVVHEGGEEDFGVSLVAGDKVWILALENAAITTGKVLAILLG